MLFTCVRRTVGTLNLAVSGEVPVLRPQSIWQGRTRNWEQSYSVHWQVVMSASNLQYSLQMSVLSQFLTFKAEISVFKSLAFPWIDIQNGANWCSLTVLWKQLTNNLWEFVLYVQCSMHAIVYFCTSFNHCLYLVLNQQKCGLTKLLKIVYPNSFK